MVLLSVYGVFRLQAENQVIGTKANKSNKLSVYFNKEKDRMKQTKNINTYIPYIYKAYYSLHLISIAICLTCTSCIRSFQVETVSFYLAKTDRYSGHTPQYGQNIRFSGREETVSFWEDRTHDMPMRQVAMEARCRE